MQQQEKITPSDATVATGLARPLGERLRHALHHCRHSDFWVMTAESYRALSVNLPVELRWHDATNPAPDADLTRIKGKERPWLRRFAMGHWCTVAYLNGEPVSYLWVSPGEWRLVDADEPGRMRADEAFFYDAYTRMDNRGNGVFFQVLDRTAGESFRRGVAKIYGLIDRTNQASRRVFSRVGFEVTPYWVRVDRYARFFAFRSTNWPTPAETT